MRANKAVLSRLRVCAGSPENLLFVYAIMTLFLTTVSYVISCSHNTDMYLTVTTTEEPMSTTTTTTATLGLCYSLFIG